MKNFAWADIMMLFISTSFAQDDLETAYQKGMLGKNQLQNGAYYLGFCPNAFVAKWEKKEQAFFYYMREKFGNIFPEIIFHPEDDNGYNLFIPYRQVEPTAEEVTKEAINVWPVLKKKKSKFCSSPLKY